MPEWRRPSALDGQLGLGGFGQQLGVCRFRSAASRAARLVKLRVNLRAEKGGSGDTLPGCIRKLTRRALGGPAPQFLAGTLYSILNMAKLRARHIRLDAEVRDAFSRLHFKFIHLLQGVHIGLRKQMRIQPVRLGRALASWNVAGLQVFQPGEQAAFLHLDAEKRVTNLRA